MDTPKHPLDLIADAALAAYGPEWQRPLARDAGLAIGTLASMIRRRTTPSDDIIRRIADAIDERSIVKMREASDCVRLAERLRRLIAD